MTLSQGRGGRRKERRGGEGRGKGKEGIEERRVQKRDEKARRVGRRRDSRQGKGREDNRLTRGVVMINLQSHEFSGPYMTFSKILF